MLHMNHGDAEGNQLTSSVPFAKMFEETELFTDLKDEVCLIVQFMRRAELYLLTAQNS